MKSSYKKHLYTTTLSLSAAVLLSVIVHSQVSADSLEAPQTEPSTVLEATPATEQAVTAETASPATAEKGDTAALATSAEAAATSDVASTTEVAPAASPSTNRVLQRPLTKRHDWLIAPFISLKRARLMTKSKKKPKLLARSTGPWTTSLSRSGKPGIWRLEP